MSENETNLLGSIFDCVHENMNLFEHVQSRTHILEITIMLFPLLPTHYLTSQKQLDC